MNDVANNERTRLRQLLFVVGLLLLLYLAGFLPAHIISRWLHIANRMPRLSSAIETVYFPLSWLIFYVFDLGEPLDPIIQAGLRVLPRP